MIRTIVFINGRPRSGKDSCVDYMRHHLTVAGVETCAFSSIDPVKDLLGSMGFQLEGKTPKDRNLLAEFGDSLEAYNGYRSIITTNWVKRFFRANETGVVFLHAREPKMIQRISGLIGEFTKVQIVTVLVSSLRSENDHTNRADSSVEDMRYDRHILNNGTLVDLENSCLDLLGELNLLPSVHNQLIVD